MSQAQPATPEQLDALWSPVHTARKNQEQVKVPIEDLRTVLLHYSALLGRARP